MWIIPKNLERSSKRLLLFTSVLVMPFGMVFSMVIFSHQPEILNHIIGLIFVEVMDVVSLWNLSIVMFPYIPMEIASLAIGFTVVAILAKRVSAPIKSHEGERCRFVAENIVPFCKHFIYRLPSHSKSYGHTGKAMSLFVKRIHLNRFFIVSWCAHLSLTIPERVASVNQ